VTYFTACQETGATALGLPGKDLEGVFSFLMSARATYWLACYSFFQFYGWCIFFSTGQKPCTFVFRKMHLKLKENSSVLDFTPSQEGACKFRIGRKKRVSINPGFIVLTAGKTVIPIVLWEVTLHANGITSRKTAGHYLIWQRSQVTSCRLT
jgi:hypothetical protein